MCMETEASALLIELKLYKLTPEDRSQLLEYAQVYLIKNPTQVSIYCCLINLHEVEYFKAELVPGEFEMHVSQFLLQTTDYFLR